MIHPSRLEPFDDFLIVKLDKDARITSGGIHLPGMKSKETKRYEDIVKRLGLRR